MECSKCSAHLSPIVAVDIDQTLGQYHAHFENFAEGYLGHTLPSEYDGSMPYYQYLGLDIEVYRGVKLAYRQGGLKRTMPLFDGATFFMSTVAEAGAEIWVTTTRPYLRLDNIDPDTREWLKRNHLPYDHMLYDEDKYMQLRRQVDPERVVGVVDDLPEQVENAQEAFGRDIPLLVDRRTNSGVLALAPRATLVDAGVLLASRIGEWYKRHGN